MLVCRLFGHPIQPLAKLIVQRGLTDACCMLPELMLQTNLCIIQLALPAFVQPLVLISPVPEGSDCAHIEVILAHADARLPCLTHRLV